MKNFACMVALIALTPAFGAVADSNANGFTVQHSFQVKAVPADVYRLLVQVGEWWAKEHTWSGDARNLSIKDAPQGCFCEKLAGGGGVRHMEVVYAEPGKQLVMLGGLGPMMSMAVAGTMTIRLAPAGGGTKVDVTYAVGGYSAGGLNTLAAPVDGVIGLQFGRLKNLAERGN